MDVSELRKAILRALDEARKEAVDRRAAMDEAGLAYRAFLDKVATPLLRQAVGVLRAEGQMFSLHTPAESVRLASDANPLTFVELTLDRSGQRPQVMGRVSLARGRQGSVIDERPVGPGKPIADVHEQDLTAFLVDAIPKVVVGVRS